MMNNVKLNGSVVRKTLDQRTGRLYVTMRVYNRTRNKTYVDFPVIMFEGEKAKKINELIPEFERGTSVLVEVKGHLFTEMYLRRVQDERNRYERAWRQMIAGESLEVVETLRSKNEAELVGTVRRVWSNADEGKRFYIITLATDLGDVSVVYFDHKMELEPEDGEILKCDAVIHTRSVQQGERRYTEFSVNAWRVTRVPELKPAA